MEIWQFLLNVIHDNKPNNFYIKHFFINFKLNIKIVWFIIMNDVQQKLSNFHGILDIAFYYLVS
jgi:hypothetical protein